MDEVFRNLDIAGEKGGLFCCPTHVIEPVGLVQIDDEVCARAADAVPHHEMIVVLVGVNRERPDVVLSGGTWSPQALPRSQEGIF